MVLEKLVIPIGFDMGVLLEGVKLIEGLISGAIDRTKQWAEDMDKLGDVTGMETDQLAAWSFVTKKAGVDADAFSSAVVIMAKGLLDSSGELSTTGKALQDFGVDVLDAGGNVKDQSELMDDIAKKYAEFGTQTERVDFLTNIFGRSGAQLIDVFDTLSKEGGIDKVAEKVKDLGLVLDPTQYEDFQRNLNEVDLTFTGLANAFTGPLLPGATQLLEKFTSWLQSPWVADSIANIGEKLGTLASDIATGIQTGNWDAFFADFKEFTGIDIQPLIDELFKFSDWAINEGIPKWNQFIQNTKTSMADFKSSSQTETSAIKMHWLELLNAIGERFNIIFGTEGINLVINWKQVGITALQLVDIILVGLTKTWQFFNDVLSTTIALLSQLANAPSPSQVLGFSGASGGGGGYTPYPGAGINRRAAGGMSGGLTLVGEKGAELVNLPSGSYVNNAQSSASMGIDYYKLASVLAVEIAKLRD